MHRDQQFDTLSLTLACKKTNSLTFNSLSYVLFEMSNVIIFSAVVI